jgi:6-phosphogluconolactonase
MGAIEKVLLERGSCSVMLTGGRSAHYLYQVWGALPEFSRMRDVHFYFGDERCVSPDHPESNYGLAMRTLFQRGVPQDCSVIRIEAERTDCHAVASAYEQQLPNRVDVLLLSVGEDGHIASLFPQSDALFETSRRVVPVLAPKLPHARLTVTPLLIAQVEHIVVMALGAAKAAVFKQSQVELQDIADLPARLVSSATWLLDTN